MRRCIFILLFTALTAAGCSGEDGPVGPPGSGGTPGAPLPIDVLLAASEPADSLRALAIEMFSLGLLPLGSTVNVVDITDSIPPLSVLNGYDAMLVWTDNAAADPAALGDRLADYVDADGGVVVAQLSFVNGTSLQGRIMSPGYSPLLSAPSAGTPPPRKIDFNSVPLPLHPMLNGINLINFPFYSTTQWSNAVVSAGATVVARDDKGAPAVATSANGRVVGLGISGNFLRGGYSEQPKLVVNALLSAAGAF